MKVLVLGGQSQIGGTFARVMARDASSIFLTTRRTDEAALKTYFLDLERSGIPWGDSAFDVVLAAAAVSRFADCEEQPARTRSINVDNTLAVCENLLRNGSFLIYLSSSAVFDGQEPKAVESAAVNPTTEYGRQKADAESGLLQLARSNPGQVAVVRLTKLVTAKMPLLSGWLDALASGRSVSAYINARLSPVSMSHLMRFLVEVSKQRKSGIFHCTGQEDVTYADFARRLVLELGLSADLVHGCEATAADMLYRPRYCSLGADATVRNLGIGPQPLAAAVTDLVAEYRGLRAA